VFAPRGSKAERRFNETEVDAIFARATAREQNPHHVSSADGGLTLSDLQQIGGEVGVAPQLIADAAHALDAGGHSATRTFLGIPLRVERIIRLERRLSDAEWEQTVVALREIFDARGRVRSEGSLRQWANGNLHVFLEPVGNAYRLRLRTFKGNAPRLMAMGIGVAGAAGAGLTAQVLSGATGPGFLMPFALVTAAGASVLAATVLRLPGWARRRREQMDEVATRVADLEASREREPDGER
jgi:hypothetical protein